MQFVPCFQTRHTFHRPIQIGWKAKGYRRYFKLVRVYNFRVGAGSLVDSYYRVAVIVEMEEKLRRFGMRGAFPYHLSSRCSDYQKPAVAAAPIPWSYQFAALSPTLIAR